MRISRITQTAVLVLIFPLIWIQSWSQQQQLSSVDRGRAREILEVITSDVKKHYYDPKLHGVDWDAKVTEAREGIDKAESFNRAMSVIAAVLDSLNDSHTFFLPPQHPYRMSYEFQYQMVGDHCFVTQVRPKSDADSKGLQPGDEVLAINGYNVTRDVLWKMQYVFNILRPQPGLRLALENPSGVQRQVEVASRVRAESHVKDFTGGGGGNDIWDLIREQQNQEHLMRWQMATYGDRLSILKIPAFLFSQSEVEKMTGNARKYPALIIDLRGNPGGSVDTLKYLVAGVFDKEIKIADRVGRKETKPEVAKAGHNPFTGKLVVLVDSRSASAAELFARLVQLEKRGTVIGDHSSGSVMEAKHYEEKMGSDTIFFYGASVTEWDLIMSDGKSLEHLGVAPDEVALPTAHDLAANRDPVLAKAAGMLGVNLSPEEAGKLFPYEWPRE